MWQAEGRRVFRLQHCPNIWDKRGGKKKDYFGRVSESNVLVRKYQAKEDMQNKSCSGEESCVRQKQLSSNIHIVLSHWLGTAQGKCGLSMSGSERYGSWKVNYAPHIWFS